MHEHKSSGIEHPQYPVSLRAGMYTHLTATMGSTGTLLTVSGVSCSRMKPTIAFIHQFSLVLSDHEIDNVNQNKPYPRTINPSWTRILRNKTKNKQFQFINQFQCFLANFNMLILIYSKDKDPNQTSQNQLKGWKHSGEKITRGTGKNWSNLFTTWEEKRMQKRRVFHMVMLLVAHSE